MFKSNKSIRSRVMQVINQKIDDAQKELEAEVRFLHAKHLEEVKESEARLQRESDFAIEKHVSAILNKVI